MEKQVEIAKCCNTMHAEAATSCWELVVYEVSDVYVLAASMSHGTSCMAAELQPTGSS